MKIDFYNIPDKSSQTNFAFSLDQLKLVLILKNKPANEQIITLLTNISKSVEAEDSKKHLIIDQTEFNQISKDLVQTDQKILLIAFGLSAEDLKWQVSDEVYKKIQIKNINIIWAHSAEELIEHKSHKISLWKILKNYS